MKKSISVIIPAYNEEKNIINLLGSICRQKETNFILKEILVLSDGSKDNTELLVSKYARRHKKVRLLADGKRVGKSERLNQLYRLSKSDFLLSLDADVVLKKSTTISELVKKMAKSTDIVGARFIPVPQNSFMGKLSIISYLSFEDAFLKLNNGNNIYSLVGGAHLIRVSFAKNVIYPRKTISDQNYLYGIASEKKDGYKFAKNAEVYMRTVSTFHDWRVLGVRSTIEDKASLRRNLGDKIMEEYYMPRRLLVVSLLKYLFKSPFYTVGSILMNIYIRKFPYNSSKPKNGKWELTLSSKIGIIM